MLSSSANLGATPGSIDADNLILDGGTLRANSSFTLDNNKGITLNTVSTIQTDSLVTLTYGGIITGSVGYFKTGEEHYYYQEIIHTQVIQVYQQELLLFQAL